MDIAKLPGVGDGAPRQLRGSADVQGQLVAGSIGAGWVVGDWPQGPLRWCRHGPPPVTVSSALVPAGSFRIVPVISRVLSFFGGAEPAGRRPRVVHAETGNSRDRCLDTVTA